MQIVILCGGLATRLGDLAKDTPKSMVLIEGKPFLEHQITFLKYHGVTDIILCVGYLAEKIKDYFDDGKRFGIHIQYSHDGDKPLGPIGALKKAEPLLEDIFFTMYGDSYVFVEFNTVYSYFTNHRYPALMIVYKNKDKYDRSNLIVHNSKVTCYNGEKVKEMVYIDYGISIFKKKVLDIIPKNTFFSTNEFFSDLVAKKQLFALDVNKRFYHIGNPEALEEFKTFVSKTNR
ncbi:MAG: sugar phosphate nucleotidyltransferase [Euryarchaeota archaeon]|nr:sugar phosphate nucleotidyltransferase [Euryarchaeota archaeon]